MAGLVVRPKWSQMPVRGKHWGLVTTERDPELVIPVRFQTAQEAADWAVAHGYELDQGTKDVIEDKGAV